MKQKQEVYRPTRFAERHPSGAFLLSEFLADVLRRADRGGGNPELGFGPIEQWTETQWAQCAKRFAAFFENIRKATAAGSPLQGQGTANGLGKGETLRRLRGIRRYVAEIEFAAKRDFGALRGYLHAHKGVHGHIAGWLRDWLAEWDAARQGGTPRREWPLVTAIFGQDFLGAPSDELSREIGKTIQQGSRAFTAQAGFDFPVALGEIHKHRADDRASYALQLVPHAEDSEIPFWREAGIRKGERGLEVRAQLAHDAQERIDRAMVAYAAQLGDQDSDLMLFFMSKFAEKAERMNDLVTVDIDELLAFACRVHLGGKGGRSYRAEDIQALRHKVEDLQRLDLSVHGLWQGKRGDYQGRVFTIHEKLGQKDLTGRVNAWDTITFGFGRVYSYRIIGLEGRQRMQLQMQALRYSSTAERFEKRLAKYFGPFWRLVLTKHGKSYYVRTIEQTITDGLTEPLERFTTRDDAERLERALDRLQNDGLIAGWQYTNQEPRIDQQGRLASGWRELWLNRLLEVEVAPSVAKLYGVQQPPTAQLRRVSHQVGPITAPAGLQGESIRQWRETQGITLPQLAEALDVTKGYLSKVETNKKPVTIALRKRFAAFRANRSKLGPLLPPPNPKT